jgi:hypothetical protein
MMQSAKSWWIGGALAATLVSQLAVVAPASAGQPFYGWGAPFGQNSIYTMRRIPYYSQHPPVYYSRPVPRTYGYSPYAYPPGVMTPDLAPEPELTVNPYIPESERPPRPVSTKPAKIVDKAPRVANPHLSETESDEVTHPAALKSASLRVEPITFVARRPESNVQSAAVSSMSDLEQVAIAWSSLSDEARNVILDVARYSK